MGLIKKFSKRIVIIFGTIILCFIALWHVFVGLLGGLVSSMGILALLSSHSKEVKNSENNTKQVYSDGRKTVASFGSRKQFAIIKGVDLETQKTTWCLFDRDKNGFEGTIDYIDDYTYMPPYVYAKGEKGYTKLNYETAEFKQSENLSDFSDEDQEIFKNISLKISYKNS